MKFVCRISLLLCVLAFFLILLPLSQHANADGGDPNLAWVSGTTSLTFFNPDGSPSGSIPVVGGPQYLSLPGGYALYVTTRQGGIDAVVFATRRVIPLISGGKYGPMDYDAVTGQIYAPDEQNQQLDVLTPWTPGTDATPHEP